MSDQTEGAAAAQVEDDFPQQETSPTVLYEAVIVRRVELLKIADGLAKQLKLDPKLPTEVVSKNQLPLDLVGSTDVFLQNRAEPSLC
eukprot:m.301802 g.301802  ORF g.301802 m.301802 type:complete len:87 (-) comp27279_c3_seq2:146-406(-)